MLKAPRLRRGDAIGIVSPAGPAHTPQELQHASRHAELLGLVPVFGKHATDRYGYLAGKDSARAEDFNRFARDPQIRGIFALRGGYGVMRILDEIDYAALLHDPKVVLGFSDITALLNAITVRTGLITFHGPAMAHASFTSDVLEGIKRSTMHREPLGPLRVRDARSIHGGRARGKLMGGNLSIVAALSGGPFRVPCDNAILLLEDVREAPYRIDRMLTTLRINGDIERAAAIGLGNFPLCEPHEGDDIPSLTLAEVFADRLAGLDKPVLGTLEIGHVERQWTLPLGAWGTLDADAKTFSVDESAVT